MAADRAARASRRRRRLGALALALPVLLGLLAVSARELRPGTLRETPCWILPNLRVLGAPGLGGCALESGDALRRVGEGGRVVRVEGWGALRGLLARSQGVLVAWVEREGRTQPVELPVRALARSARLVRLLAAALVAGLLLGVAVSLRLRSSAAAAPVLALFYANLALLAVCGVAGRASPSASIAALLCLTLVPGLLLHLAFSFPTESRLRRELPAVVALPYAASAFLLVMGSVALWQTPALWPAFLTLLTASCAAAWTVLILACAFRLRESDSALERVRSRVVLVGSLLLPALALALAALGDGVAARQLPALCVWSAVATLPLPVALAISRYNLFDLGLDARHGVARILYLAASAAGIAGCAWWVSRLADAGGTLSGAGGLLAAAFLCALAVEPMRARLPPLLEAWILPPLPALRSARRALERRLPAVEDEHEVLACAEQALVAGVGARWGSIFAASERGLQGLHHFGPPGVPDPALAELAVSVLGGRAFVHVASLPPAGPAPRALDAAGVACVAALDASGERRGVLLLGGPRSAAFYRGVEVAFAATVARRTAAALARLRSQALRQLHEREAAAGRLALSLARDTGKDLHWLRLLSRRLAAQPHASRRVRRDATTIAELSQELAATVERLLAEAAAGTRCEPGEARLDDLVAAAVRRTGGVHGPDRIVDVIAPSARRVRCPDALGRLLEEALDHALRSAPPGEPVRLSARAEDGWLHLCVASSTAHGAERRLRWPLRDSAQRARLLP